MPLKTLVAWLLQLTVNAIPGLLHQWRAARDLEESLETLPTFNPYRSPRYWLLRFFFFAFPTLLFWVIVPTVFRIAPPSLERDLRDVSLWGMAVAFGLLYTFCLNAPLSILSAGVLDSVKLDTFVIDTVSKAIVRNQKDNVNLFWGAVGKDLRLAANQTQQQNYQAGYQFLRDGWLHRFPAVSENQKLRKLKFEKELNGIRPRILRNDLDHKTVKLLQWLVEERVVSRKQLPSVLGAFGCHQCVQKYFSSPKSF